MNVVALFAGDSEAFHDAGHAYPKNLVEIGGEPLVQRVLTSQPLLQDPENRVVCLVRGDEDRRFHTGDVLRLLAPRAEVLAVPEQTGGAVCTAMLALEKTEPDLPLLVMNGDVVLDLDVRPLLRDFELSGLDGGIIVFRAVHPRWSYVRVDDNGLVQETAEKRPISDLATVGYYWFRRAGDLWSAAQRMIVKDAHVDGRFYVCPSYNEMVLDGARIGTAEIPGQLHHSLATPQGVTAYEDHLRQNHEEHRAPRPT